MAMAVNQEQERFYGYPLLREVELKCFELKQNITTATIAQAFEQEFPGLFRNNGVSRGRIFRNLKKLEAMRVITHHEVKTKNQVRQFIFTLNNGSIQN